MNPQIKKEIEACNTVKAALNVIQKYYDCENCKPGTLVKGTLWYGITEKIPQINPWSQSVTKSEAMASNNLSQFIDALKRNILSDHALTIAGKQGLVSNIDGIVTLTGLQEKNPSKPVEKKPRTIIDRLRNKK